YQAAADYLLWIQYRPSSRMQRQPIHPETQGQKAAKFFGHSYEKCQTTIEVLSPEDVADGLLHYGSAYLRNRARQRDVLWTNLHAILRVAAFLDSSVAHEGPEAFRFQCRTGWVGVEEPNLRDRSCTNKAGVLVELGTDLHATAARNTPRQGVG